MKVNNVGLDKPLIRDLNTDNEIDLDQLGTEDLVTYIKYAGIKVNDLVSPSWLGASATGEAFDDVGATYPVRAEDLQNGLKIDIRNDLVRGAEGGEAFYSYTVNGTERSLRRFCFVGVRDRAPAEGLSPIQAIQSQGLIIQPDKLETVGVMFIVMPYQAMQVDDVITFTFQGFDEEGYPEPPETETLKVKKEHFGNMPLMFTVGKNIFRFIDPGSAQVSYSVAFADGKSLDSPVQAFVIDSDATLPTPLPVPRIVGHTPGDPLDPGHFRDGLTIHIDGYPGMSISDHVTLYWRSPARDLFTHVRVDASTQTVGAIVLHVPVEFVLENQGMSISLSYLFSREGAGLQSQPLTVAIATARVLSVPLVIDATPDEGKDHGTLPLRSASGGVRVQIPDVLLPGESAEVHWRGWPVFGEYVARQPEGANPLVFLVPKEFVPANVGRGQNDQSRRFEVAYRVLGKDTQLDSAPYHLRITPVQRTAYPTIQCGGVVDEILKLSAVPSGGADLTLGSWTFGRVDQLLHIWVSGVGPEGSLVEDIRTASVPVTEDEASKGVGAKLPKAFLEQLKLNTTFTLHVALSYDGGALYRDFPTISITLQS